MVDYRPLHEVIVAQLVHLCEIYATEAGIAGPGVMTTKLVGLGAEISALCAVLENGVVPSKHLSEVVERLRKVEVDRLSGEGMRNRHAAMRVGTLILNLGARGGGVDELRPLHEVILRWLEHLVDTFASAVRVGQEDKVYVVGAEIQACCHALQCGVVPETEIRGATAWVTRLKELVPRAEGNVTVEAVTRALALLESDLQDRRLPSPAQGREVAPDA